MEPTDATGSCRVCVMTIPARAKKCPYCLSWQRSTRPLHRDVEGRVLGGVCGALASHLNLDVTLVRVLFAAGAALSAGLVFWVYALLWLGLPASEGGTAPLARVLDWFTSAFSSTRRSAPPPPASPPTSPA